MMENRFDIMKLYTDKFQVKNDSWIASVSVGMCCEQIIEGKSRTKQLISIEFRVNKIDCTRFFFVPNNQNSTEFRC